MNQIEKGLLSPALSSRGGEGENTGALTGSRSPLVTRHSPLSKRAGLSSGFSLIEFIGVMAVLAILASAMAPLVVRQSDKSVLANEVAQVSAISNALSMDVIRNRAVPDETTWANVAANWTMRPAAQISRNPRRFDRAYLIDSSGWLGGYAAGSPYSQAGSASGLSSRPTTARAMIVSTIATGLPVASGRPASAAFNDIWITQPLAKPSTWTTWGGSGADLVIQRITLDPLFHHLVLGNRDASTDPAFTIDSTSSANAVAVVNNGVGQDAYYLDGTVVGLWVAGTLKNQFILTSDISFNFNGGMWRAQLAGGSANNSGSAKEFAKQAALFIATPNPPGNNQGADTQGALSAFYSFMYAYTIWGNECPHFLTTASSSQQPADYRILDGMGANNAIIDATTGSKGGGLLK